MKLNTELESKPPEWAHKYAYVDGEKSTTLISDERLLEIMEKYKPENFEALMMHTFPRYGEIMKPKTHSRKLKIMNKRELTAMQKAADIAQKEAADKAFKQTARLEALRSAERLCREPFASPARVVQKDIIKESERIYQWLIKVLK